jgi:hypothetical protein
MSSLRASTEMTESLSVLKGGFGGEPLLTTVQLHLASLVYITPINFGLILTVRFPSTSSGFVSMSGSAPEGTAVTVVITCGGDQQTLQDVADSIGHWGVNATFTLSGPTTCTVKATAGTGIQAGSVTMEINFR